MTAIVTVFRTIKNSSLYAGLLTIIGVTAPFSHLLSSSDQVGILGYTYMTSFLFAVGFPISMVSFALLLKYGSQKMIDGYSKPFNQISNIILFVGCFYILWVLLPIQDYSKSVYYTFLGAVSIASGYAITMLHYVIIIAEEKLRHTIQRLFKFILKDTPHDLTNEADKKAYYVKTETLITEVANEY